MLSPSTKRSCLKLQTPLGSFSVDVAVFCLSLMGTNFANYLGEAHRVLKKSYEWSVDLFFSLDFSDLFMLII